MLSSFGISKRFAVEWKSLPRKSVLIHNSRRKHDKSSLTSPSSSTSPSPSLPPAEKDFKNEETSERLQAKFEKLRRRQQRQDQLKNNKLTVKKSPTWKPKMIVSYDIPTIPGDKKDTTHPLPESYSPSYVEASWYAWWERMGFFKPEQVVSSDNANMKPYTMCLPPPNVTGKLHLGHSLMVAIQDSLVRWNRMCGKPALWLPGCDHAGIATQIMVEKSVYQSSGKTRHDLGKEEFTKEVWKWKNEKGDDIYRQLKKLGASLDWERSKFTMDKSYSHSVCEAFIRLHDKGIIYRSNQLVNWSCSLKSVISDIEVENITVTGPTPVQVPGYTDPVQFGTLHFFSYPVHKSDEMITVATTRPETMLGDTALAVHPDDSRYGHLIGRTVEHPFSQRLLPVIADASVDINLGTGAVKITPAHDYRDYDMALKHDLPFITVIDDTGHMTKECGQFLGLRRFDARQAVLEALKQKRLYIDSKHHNMDIPICRRSKDIVEPMLKTQWFVDTRQMAKDAIACVDTGQLNITPATHKKTWYQWLNNIRDWCISRQLWWGHRIPVYRVTSEDTNHKAQLDSADVWVSAHTEQEAILKAAGKLSIPAAAIQVEQDPDVLDTWFSSSIFPFAILGWPNQTADLDRHYPTVMLETGHDILFFWVARMVMMAKELTDVLPFTEVYLHSMVRDAHGRKMSKSLGNVIDPMDVIHGCTLEDLRRKLMSGVKLDEPELTIALSGQSCDYPNGIPECGTDALRFALCTYKAQVADINLSIETVLKYRRFCNKIWNATRFCLDRLGAGFTPVPLAEMLPFLRPIDRWILSRLSATANICNEAFKDYEFPTATSAIYDLWVLSFCDIYLESVKSVLASDNQQSILAAQNTLYHCVHAGLCLLSPFMPYVTEELYQRLPKVKGDLCPSVCLAKYPSSEHFPERNLQLECDVDLIGDIVHVVRSIQSEYHVNMKKTNVGIICNDSPSRHALDTFLDTIATLSRCSDVAVTSAVSTPSGCVSRVINNDVTVYLNIKDSVNLPLLSNKLKSQKLKLEGQLVKLESIEGAGDHANVPVAVLHKKRQRIEHLQTELRNVQNTIAELEVISNDGCS